MSGEPGGRALLGAALTLGAVTGYEVGKEKKQRAAGVGGGLLGTLAGERLLNFTLSTKNNPAIFAGAIGAAMAPAAGAFVMSALANKFRGHQIHEQRPALKKTAENGGGGNGGGSLGSATGLPAPGAGTVGSAPTFDVKGRRIKRRPMEVTKNAAYTAGIKEALLQTTMARNVIPVAKSAAGKSAKKSPKPSKTLGMDQRASRDIQQAGVDLKQKNFQPPVSARPPRA